MGIICNLLGYLACYGGGLMKNTEVNIKPMSTRKIGWIICLA